MAMRGLNLVCPFFKQSTYLPFQGDLGQVEEERSSTGVTTEVVLQDSSEARKFVPVFDELEEKPLSEQRGLREN
jgi:hypothetical protein